MALLTRNGQVVTEISSRRADSLIRPLHQVEKSAIESAMILCVGNITLAAKRLGIGRSSLYRKLEEYRLTDQ